MKKQVKPRHKTNEANSPNKIKTEINFGTQTDTDVNSRKVSMNESFTFKDFYSKNTDPPNRRYYPEAY